MSKAIKCDKCGQLKDEDGASGKKISIDDNHWSGKKVKSFDVQITVTVNLGDRWTRDPETEHPDICKECFRECVE